MFCLTPLIYTWFGFFRELRIGNRKLSFAFLCVLCVFAVQISGFQHRHIEFTKGMTGLIRLLGFGMVSRICGCTIRFVPPTIPISAGAQRSLLAGPYLTAVSSQEGWLGLEMVSI